MKRWFALFVTLVFQQLIMAETPVYIVPLEGPVDQAQMYILRRAFNEAEAKNAAAIIIEMDTPGGGLIQTEEILDRLRNFPGRTIAYVTKHAQSAGAILCLGHKEVYMAPGSRMGSAAPILVSPTGSVMEVNETLMAKIMSDTRAMVRGLAQENDYPEDLAEAFVDTEVEFTWEGQVISKAGELLNLTALEAASLKKSDGAPLFVRGIANDRADLLRMAKLDGLPQVELQVTEAEKLAQWITMMAPLFLIIGGLGLFIEFKTPGFGLPGLVGIAFLTIFFFGHHVAGLANQEEMILIFVGLILLAIEIFVTPGFGVMGALGLLCVFGGVGMSMVVDGPVSIEISKTYIYRALWSLTITGVGLIGIAWLLLRNFDRTFIGKAVVLTDALEHGGAVVADEVNPLTIGATGVALTPLHPGGKAEFNQRRVDVICDGQWIDRGQPVVIKSIQGIRVLVEAVTE